MKDATTEPPTSEGGGAGYLLMKSAAAWRISLAHRLAHLDITPSQFFIIATVYHRHRAGKVPLSQRQISERAGLDINVVSQIVRALEVRSIVERRRHRDDARAHEVTLSAAGIDLAKTSTEIARRFNTEFFARTDSAALTGLLENIKDAV